MFIFFYISLILILVLLFMISYVIIERIRNSKIFFQWKIYGYIKNVLEGLIYSVLIVFFNLLLNVIDQNIVFPIFITGVLVLTIIRNIVVGIFAIFAPLIYFLINHDIDMQLYIALILMISMLFAVEIVQYFVKDFWWNLAINNLWMIFAFLSVLIYDFIFFHHITKISMEIIFVPYLGSLIIYIFLEIIIKFLISANILSKAVSFNFSRYYRQSLKEVAINDFVSEYKLTKGIYGIFEFNYQEPGAIERNLEIKESILIDLEKIFPQKGVLFRADETRYGFFLPWYEKVDLKQSLNGNNKIKRDDYDFLKNIENLLQIRSIKYITSWKEKILIQIRAGVAIYGLQDYSIYNLHKFADFALQNELSNQKNSVQLFDVNDYFYTLDEKHLLNEMDAAIRLDNFVNYFTPIFDFKKQTTVMHIVTSEKIEYSEIKESTRDYINFFEWTNVFDRYMAFWALSKINGKLEKIAFFYSPQILEQKFNFELFKHKLKKVHTSIAQIIFIFDPLIFAQIKNKTVFFQNLQLLVQEKLQIALINVDQYKIDDLKNLNPNYYLVQNQQEFIKLQTFLHLHQIDPKLANKKIVWFNLQNQTDLHFAINSGSTLLGGSLLQKDQFMINLNKKSKMYVYELLKNWGK